MQRNRNLRMKKDLYFPLYHTSMASIISLHLLISYSILTQLWIYCRRISLSGDIKLNLGPK